MKATFDPALRLLLRHEGGFVNNPHDPGGITNLGVTKRAWEGYVGHMVTEDDMRHLTPDTVTHFYKARYWDAVRADELPAGLDDCLFDCCVNSGPGRAVRLLQGALGLTQDGVVGPQTLASAAAEPAHRLISAYCELRLIFMETLPTWATFGKGWTTRVRAVEQEALVLAGPALAGHGLEQHVLN